MPRTDGQSLQPPRPRAVVASAKLLQGLGKKNDRAKRRRQPQDEAWQDRVWYYYDVVVEYRYMVQRIGNALSKAILYAAKDGKRTEDPNAVAAVDRLFSTPEGRSKALGMMGIHLEVPGECWVVAQEKGGLERWEVVSASEIKTLGEDYTLRDDTLPDNAIVLRIWRPHPRDSRKADSPSRAALPILQEVDNMSQYISAQSVSRLAGAGLLVLPNDIDLPGVPQVSEDGQSITEADGIAEVLVDAASAAIKDRSAPEALIPVILQADGEHLDKIKHITFSTDVQTEAKEIREAAMMRLARGMDLPPEAALGDVGSSNHWSAWAISEDEIKIHVEPLLELLIDSLSEKYMRPAMLAADSTLTPEEAQRFSIGADTSKIRTRPNRSKEALELFDRLELSGAALRRETGFDDDDKMQDKEKSATLLMKLAQGSPTPELVALANFLLGALPEIPESAGEQQTKAPETPSLLEHPTQDIPDREAASLAAEVILFRAMERAGNKLKTKHKLRVPGVDACDLYRHADLVESDIDAVLEDAWTPVPRFASAFGMDPDVLTSRLDGYARHLMKTKAEHDPALLTEYLGLS